MDKTTKIILGCIAAAVLIPIIGITLLTIIGLTVLGRPGPVENTFDKPASTETREPE